MSTVYGVIDAKARGGDRPYECDRLADFGKSFELAMANRSFYGMPGPTAEDDVYKSGFESVLNTRMGQYGVAIFPELSKNIKQYSDVLAASYAMSKDTILSEMDMAAAFALDSMTEEDKFDMLYNIMESPMNRNSGVDPTRTAAGESWSRVALSPEMASYVIDYARDCLQEPYKSMMESCLSDTTKSFLSEQKGMAMAISDLYDTLNLEIDCCRRGESMIAGYLDFERQESAEAMLISNNSSVLRRAQASRRPTQYQAMQQDIAALGDIAPDSDTAMDYG